MRYASTVKAPPRWNEVTPALRAARAEWYAQNPWTPDWAANERALKGAGDAMREAERTQKEGELEARRAAAKVPTLRRAA